VNVRYALEADSPWFRDLDPGATLRLPIAHGEGSYFHPGGFDAVRSQAPLLYEENPNGSVGDVAALLDATGRVLGIMPHPERASDPDLGSEDGSMLFSGARSWVVGHSKPRGGPPSTVHDQSDQRVTTTTGGSP
jgi:phosphoribosylformylglycinamidine synthase